MTNKKTEQELEELLAQFEKENCVIHPGDSGVGGNYPQEPIYECQATRQDLKKLVDNAFSLGQKSEREVPEKIKELRNRLENSKNTYFNDIPYRQERIDYIIKEVELLFLSPTQEK